MREAPADGSSKIRIVDYDYRCADCSTDSSSLPRRGSGCHVKIWPGRHKAAFIWHGVVKGAISKATLIIAPWQFIGKADTVLGFSKLRRASGYLVESSPFLCYLDWWCRKGRCRTRELDVLSLTRADISESYEGSDAQECARGGRKDNPALDCSGD